MRRSRPGRRRAPLTALTTRVAANETSIATNAAAITALQTGLAGKADATALQALGVRVTATEAGVQTNADAITALQAASDGSLGPEENEFAGDDRAAAEAARDAYAMANPAWLAQYDANPDNQIELQF